MRTRLVHHPDETAAAERFAAPIAELLAIVPNDLVAPALRIHPITETVLRYLSPRVEWSLLAIDERWRQEIRVVWRKSSDRS